MDGMIYLNNQEFSLFQVAYYAHPLLGKGQPVASQACGIYFLH